MYEYDDEPDEFKVEIPWLGFVDVTSATLASVMILVMVFGLSAAVTMAAIEASERELYKTGLIYPFDEYREYIPLTNNGWQENNANKTITYIGKWSIPVLDNGGGDYIHQQLSSWGDKRVDLTMTVLYNPNFTFRGAALETGYEQINEIRKRIADLGINVKTKIVANTITDKKIGEIQVTISSSN